MTEGVTTRIRTTLLVLAAALIGALACQPASRPVSGECPPLPRSARGCLDGNVIRPIGCELRNGPTGPDSPGAKCTCVERSAIGITAWDCKEWM